MQSRNIENNNWFFKSSSNSHTTQITRRYNLNSWKSTRMNSSEFKTINYDYDGKLGIDWMRNTTIQLIRGE